MSYETISALVIVCLSILGVFFKSYKLKSLKKFIDTIIKDLKHNTVVKLEHRLSVLEEKIASRERSDATNILNKKEEKKDD